MRFNSKQVVFIKVFIRKLMAIERTVNFRMTLGILVNNEDKTVYSDFKNSETHKCHMGKNVKILKF